MELGELIVAYRKEANLTIDELVEMSGVPKGTLNKIIAGTTKAPTLGTVKAIARTLGKTLDDFDDSPKKGSKISALSDAARTLAKRYEALDRHGKNMVDLVAGEETARMEQARAALPDEEPEMRTIKRFLEPAAAGPGSHIFDSGYEEVSVPADTRGDFIVRISGDSMEPYIKDGQDVFVAIGEPMRDGDVGIFFYDGNTYCKQYCESFGFIYLFSLNRKRADADVVIRAKEGLRVECYGKALLEKRPPLPPT